MSVPSAAPGSPGVGAQQRLVRAQGQRVPDRRVAERGRSRKLLMATTNGTRRSSK
jgi:hypothetical protein